MIKIVIVDDHRIVRQGIKAMLQMEYDFEIVGEASSGTEALSLLDSVTPDVLVTDLKLEDMSGIDVTRLVRDRCPHTRSIVLSMFNDRVYVVGALKAGAKGYVPKGSGIDDLIRAIRQVASGSIYLSPCLPPDHQTDHRHPEGE